MVRTVGYVLVGRTGDGEGRGTDTEEAGKDGEEVKHDY